MLRLGYSRPAIVNRTHIPRPILARLSWERKWKVDHQARPQKVAYEKELRARYRTKGKLSKRVVNEIRVRAGINTIQRREQIPDVSHEFTKKELAEWMRRIKPNNIPALPDIEPFYGHKTPGTKQVLLQLVGKGKTIAASFAALGFHLSVWKNWLREDLDFELALIQAVSQFQEQVIQHIQLASKKDWRAGAWLLEHHPDVRDTFNEPKEAQTPTISINFSRGADLPQIEHGVTLDHEVIRQLESDNS
jgi:hypothetical protein